MAKVTNLIIALQSGSSNTYYSTWSFGETTTTTTTGFKAGDLVSIKSNATYYNGVSIPSWVKSDKWYLVQVKGDRAVLGKNQSKSHDIQSPINTKYLTGGSGSSTTTTQESKTLDHYVVKWYYHTGDGVWFDNGESQVKIKQATYSPPENAKKIKISVKPVAKKRKVNGKETAYWSGSSVSKEYNISDSPPEKPSTPTVELEDFTLTASLQNIPDARADKMQFQVYNGTTVYKSGKVEVATAAASFTCTVAAGGEYKVRCRAINTNGDTEVYGEWSDYSSVYKTIPGPSSGITICRASSETSVYLEWAAADTAEAYDIEYATKVTYFDGSDMATVVSGIEFTHYEKTGLATGEQYFFRVRAVNDNGHSTWSEPVSVTIGDEPSAPTTWSSSTTVITGEALTLYWMHNAQDGSSQRYAELEITIGDDTQTYTIQNSTDEDEKDKTSSYAVDTSLYPEGTQLLWRVRTAGVTLTYGDWSIQRTVDIYAPPSLSLELRNASAVQISTLTSFPLYISALAGPNTQVPTGYHVSITANQGYEAVDPVGNPKLVSQNEEIYSNYFDISEELLLELSANHIDLEDGISYTVSCTVSMNSGLTAEASEPFNVSWIDEVYEPDAAIGIDEETLTAYIQPFCKDEDGVSVENVTLSVYRREYNGRFTQIATGISNQSNTAVTDPHPALDYARYRIVATSTTTGAISFYDVPGYPIGNSAIVIQWAEDWSSFDSTTEETYEQPAWSGSMLKLPYNVDVSDNNDMEVALVKYIGREHPVTYYGTQLGITSTWNTVIPASDKETVYALRRLALWAGDVYVREPSGSGYWANVKVSFNQKHKEVTIPVTFDITRVEGGI